MSCYMLHVTQCHMSRFLLFALVLYSSSDVISALLFKGELGSCFSDPSSNPSVLGDELSRLSVEVNSAVVASILSCPEFRAFSRARTVVTNRANLKTITLAFDYFMLSFLTPSVY